ncbi:MAG: hypothetical protein IT364_10485 [Candidatus Hydrogenedentes bacterium]|nr:hypothetical protein [Candidatus Hydrogenedentota bacterium]
MVLSLFKQFARVAMSLAVLSVAQAVVAEESAEVAPHLLSTCPVSGSELGAMGEPVSKVYDGKEVKFCCGGCPAKYEADRAKYDAEIEAKLIASQTPHYPLETCVVSGEKLGAMGEPVNYIDGSTLVRLCCKGCVPKFQANEDKYRSSLDQAVAEKQVADYPLDTCVVSGDKLGGAMGDPIDYVAGNRLIRLCCKGCIKDVAKDPAKYLQMIDEGHGGGAAEGSGHSDGHGEHQHGSADQK